MSGDPQVRFGGRGYRNQSMLPTPMITGRNKGHFSFDNIRKALDEARALRNLAVQTAQTAKQAIAWTKGLKDKTEWMADPSGDAKTLENILTNANSMGAKAIEWGRDSEATLARLEDTYAEAMELSGMTISQRRPEQPHFIDSEPRIASRSRNVVAALVAAKLNFFCLRGDRRQPTTAPPDNLWLMPRPLRL